MNFNGALEEKLPWPDEGVNKYSRGKLTVVAGSARYSGAAVLAALASQRMGAGYTEVITDPSAVNVVRLSSPSLVVRPSDDWKPGELKASEPGKPCAVCIGPGFTGDDDAAADLVARVLKKAPCPVLVDGGGLARLATKKNLHTLAARFTDGLTSPRLRCPDKEEGPVRFCRYREQSREARGRSFACHASYRCAEGS